MHLRKGLLRRLQGGGTLLKLSNHLRVTDVRQITAIRLELLGKAGIKALHALGLLRLRADLQLNTEQSRL